MKSKVVEICPLFNKGMKVSKGFGVADSVKLLLMIVTICTGTQRLRVQMQFI